MKDRDQSMEELYGGMDRNEDVLTKDEKDLLLSETEKENARRSE